MENRICNEPQDIEPSANVQESSLVVDKLSIRVGKETIRVDLGRAIKNRVNNKI